MQEANATLLHEPMKEQDEFAVQDFSDCMFLQAIELTHPNPFVTQPVLNFAHYSSVS